ncbi:hypothetical protein Tco_1138507, partial [Tanacetum coccineum]
MVKKVIYVFNDSVLLADMAPLPSRDQRHSWLRYHVEGYTEDIDDLEAVHFGIGFTYIDEEMAEDGFGAYWLGSERGQAPEKVTSVDLSYLRSMDRGTANVPYLLAQYLFRHAEGRKSEDRLFGVTSLGILQLILDWLNICVRIGDTWAWVASGPERYLSRRHLPLGLCSRGFPGLRRRYRSCEETLWGCEDMLTDRSLIRVGSLPG